MQGVPIVAVGVAIVIRVTRTVSAVVIHGVVMDTRAIRMGMITTDPTDVATHCHATDMSAFAKNPVRFVIITLLLEKPLFSTSNLLTNPPAK